MLEMTNCIAVGVADRHASAARFRTLGFEVGQEGSDWTEILAGPLRLYLVQDGTNDVAFAFSSPDLQGARTQLEEQGYVVDQEISARVGELFLRDPDGHLFNLS